jgi:thioredoxin-like negative regulator of GroEL
MLLYSTHLDAIGKRRTLLLAASWLIFLLALLAKSQLVGLPVVLLAMDLCRRRSAREALVSKLPFLALSVLFAVITIRTHAGESAAGISFPDSILVPLAALPRYLLHLLFPVGLSPHYEFTAGSFQGPIAVSAGALMLLFITVCVYRSYLGERLWLFGIVWFFAFLSPVIGIFRINIYVADRYLYLAIVGPLLALAATLLRTRFRRPALLAGSLMVIAIFSFLTTAYTSTFKNSETLWRHVLAHNPDSSIGHSNLGDTLRLSGRIAEAAAHFDKDLAQRPYLQGSFLGRAVIYIEQGDNGSARKMYELLLERRPHSVQARIECAHFLDWVGEKEEAIETLLEMHPSQANAVYYRKLFDLYSELNQPLEALAAARSAYALAPFDPAAVSRLRLAEEAAASRNVQARD